MVTWLWYGFAWSFSMLQKIELEHVWERYEKLAQDCSIPIPPSYYSRKSTFKNKLESKLGNLFSFFPSLITKLFGRGKLF